MKVEWQTKKLGEVIRLEYGKPLPDEARSPSGLYAVYGANGEKTRSNRYFHDRPSVVVGRKGSAGEINLTEDQFWPLDVTYFAKFDDSQYELKFLYYLLGTLNLPAMARGVKPGINRNDVYALAVNVPTLSEQKRIVAILDEAFAGIATAKANAEKNLQNAREIFENHLQSVFGQCGSGWVDTTIGEVTRFIDYRGKTPIKTESGLRLITAKNVKMGFVQRDPEEFVAPDSYDAWMTRGIPLKGDVLFTTEAPCGNVAQLDTAEKVVFAQRIIIMQSDRKRLDSTFLKYALLSSPLQKRIQAKATGATALGIKASLLRTIDISFPKEMKEQIRIVAKLDSLRSEISQLESLYTRKLAALNELKQSLLQQAFSGKL